jgi:hypothetical protein
MKYEVEVICLKQNTIVHLLVQALPNRKQALIISAWPSTSLPRDIVSVKRFQNLQALVNTTPSYLFTTQNVSFRALVYIYLTNLVF